MDGHQRRTARGVDGHGRSLQAEGEGDPTRDRVQRITGDEVGLDLVDGLRREQVRILVGGDPGEDAGSAASEVRGGVARPLEALPHGFEHQPLLRLDPHGLTRRDAEELGIESVDAVEESTEPCVRLPRGFGVGVVELVDVEPVFGDFPDRVDATGQQFPECLRVRRAGETARHRDDRDRLIGARRRSDFRRPRFRLGLLGQLEYLPEQVVSGVGQPRVVHHQRDGDLSAEALFQPSAEFDGHQRVHAQVEEPRVLADFRGVDAGHLRDRVAQVVGHQPFTLLRRSFGEPLDELGRTRLCRRRGSGRRGGHLTLQLGKEPAATRLLVERQEPGPVDPGHNPLCRGCRHDIGQAGERLGGGKRLNPTLFQAGTRFRVGHAGRPRPEVDADSGDALFTQPPGEPVEECVGGAVGRLAEAAPHRCDGGGGDEEVEAQVGGCLTQMPCAPDLPGEDAVDFGVVEAAERCGADDTGGMDDPRQRRELGVHGGQQAGDVVRVGDVGGDDTHIGAVLCGQRVDALPDRVAGCVPAGQHQVLGAVRGEMGSDLQPDRAQPAGHQIRCVGAHVQ
nr:hypothetical protein CPGR_04918 [Mycolicibacterium malmesburyense]